MSERCVDASVIIKLVLKGERHRRKARALVRNSAKQGIDLIVPPLFICEVDSALRKRVFDGKMSRKDAEMAQAALDRAPVQVMTHFNLRRRAREIAEQFNQRTVYDSTYAALAELHACEFWTADKAFFDAVKGSLSFVRYLTDYREAR